jgi:tRNA threonylcarbamoyl adenosine modification protein YeaZ
MNILSIESASTVCGTALFCDDKMVEIDEITSPRIHGERLPSIIDNIMKKYKVGVADLDGIAVSAGPGSYTGLRIGMSLAKGLAVSAGVPIIPVPTLDVMNRAISREGIYWILLYSHKDVVFAQRFNSGRPDSQIECAVYNAERYIHPVGFNLDTVCKPEDYELTPPSSKFVGELAIHHFHKWAKLDINTITPNYVTNYNISNIPSN